MERQREDYSQIWDELQICDELKANDQIYGQFDQKQTPALSSSFRLKKVAAPDTDPVPAPCRVDTGILPS